MAKRRGSRRAAPGRPSRAVRKPTDWVNTSECYDVSQTGTLLTLDGTIVEVALPVHDAWPSFIASNQAPVFVRSMPWPKRTCLRVKGWLHLFSPDYFTGTTEYSVVTQLEKLQTDPSTGVPLLPQVDTMLSPEYADTNPVYWKNFQHLYHNTGWTSPEDFNTFKRSVFIDWKGRVRLDENEVMCLHIQHTNWAVANGAHGATTRTFVRPMIRALIETG